MTNNNKPLTLDQAERITQQVRLLQTVKQHVPPGDLKRFSSTIKNRSTVPNRLGKGGDVKASLIMILSHRLGLNLFDLYIQCLPTHLRHTAQTRERDEIIKQKDEEILQLQSQLTQYQERHLSDQELIKAALRRG
jgi:hypothetical protein